MRTLFAVAASTALLPFAASAQTSGFADSLASLEGRWEGRLEYIDYTTGEPDTIPHTRDITLAPDRSYALQTMTFADRDTTVYDAELIVFGATGVVATSVRGDLTRSRLDLLTLQHDAYGWIATLSGDTIDEGARAEARYTWTYAGDTFSQVKEVRSDPGAAWRLRNAVRLTRAGTAAG
ncbi:hypothetical protein ACWCOP_03210 [Maricaulaceae bacterium MS644]